MNVIFFSPTYPLEMQDYTRGLAEVGANVIGVGEGPVGSIPPKSESISPITFKFQDCSMNSP